MRQKRLDSIAGKNEQKSMVGSAAWRPELWAGWLGCKGRRELQKGGRRKDGLFILSPRGPSCVRLVRGWQVVLLHLCAGWCNQTFTMYSHLVWRFPTA